MASTIAVGNGSHYFSNARRDLWRDTKCTAKELTEFKTPSGVRIQVYPTLDSIASPAEVKHVFETGRQAIIN